MRVLIILLALMLAGCGKTLATLDPAAVPDDIEECLKLKLSSGYTKDLNEEEVERYAKWDRYVAVERAKCLARLAGRDATLAGKSSRR